MATNSRISEITYSSGHDVSALAASLFSRSGINSFSYSPVYRDGSRAELWTDANALRHTFLEKKYIVGAYTPAFYGPAERYALFEKKIDTFPRQICERYAIQLNDQRYLLDHAYPFKIVSRHPDYFEYFLFYAPAKRNSIISFYINNLDVLESFASFFRVSAIGLIDKASKERVMPDAKIDRCHGWQAPEAVRRLASPHELQAFPGILTRRQLQIAQHLVAGHTARYIAGELCLSPRTVETHIENMRHKLGCANRTELVVCFLQADMQRSSRSG